MAAVMKLYDASKGPRRLALGDEMALDATFKRSQPRSTVNSMGKPSTYHLSNWSVSY